MARSSSVGSRRRRGPGKTRGSELAPCSHELLAKRVAFALHDNMVPPDTCRLV